MLLTMRYMPTATAKIDDHSDSFRGRSGFLAALPTRTESSPKVPAAILMATMVPSEYDRRKVTAARQEVIVIAGARDGAPSQENPCRTPFASMAWYDFGVEATTLLTTTLPVCSSILLVVTISPSISSSPASWLSLIPTSPINKILIPTTDSARLANFSRMENLPVNCPFKKKALNPSMHALIPCPTPHKAPIRNPTKPDLPTLGAIKAARWSGPVTACNPPDSSPPEMVGFTTDANANDRLVQTLLPGAMDAVAVVVLVLVTTAPDGSARKAKT
mmetsp:Transcript_2994/g.5100  ORF Transcript_2994/g.5100 Transcript_2994/m.5100 type:complete len:275 (-) Transcript_2994:369-1193(-)